MARVALEQVAKRFEAKAASSSNRTVAAVEGLHFEIPDGEFWVLVGPSGCGKSTVLRMIAGLEQPTEGQIYIGNQCVNQVPARQRDVAMVFQNYALYPHMTVAENLAFGLKMRRVASETIAERVHTAAKSLSLLPLLERKPSQLSGGQQQRVALGRAIVRQPQAFLLDEPLSNLDAQLREETRAELKQLHADLGITMIYVTHDQVEAMTLADQLVVLNRGRVQQIGPPQEVYARPANRMIATFLGSPSMNLLQAVYDGEQFQFEDGQSLDCPEHLRLALQSAQGRKLELGIRPEHLHLVSGASEGSSDTLQATVRLVEPLGSETLLRLALSSGQTLNLRVPPTQRQQVGEQLTIRPDPSEIMLFDAATGDRLPTATATA
ncbi:ABC transporter ATP-binding protein [Leptolyngbya sp. FACHB-261]|uniref:ABC transporter ATP-binding protein n=1 Tax=Leptolyngbya sp. FACHB-261 TaxID=2692806 RepID=UPI001688B413|nr:sn-glycerol-3-phosphate ABC transporter ATP-binding protein UgpC [Leptolyngbya sp. FACHB-261]MBD2102788.1 sn-glycerol-3-phosphate ABC transporter ATP-binding protein UgpC [Leptolyngbya sp. FACHB-261]